MTQTPILFYGDSPSLQTGLGRIGRDHATRTCELPEFRVGFLGRGGIGSRNLPFIQYDFDEVRGWGSDQMIQHVWENFAGDSGGIIFAIYDPSRTKWLSQGEWMRRNRHRVKLWTYVPVDGACGNERLTDDEYQALYGFDRVLAYGEYGARVLSGTIGSPVDWLPHGIDTKVFKPQDRRAARVAMEARERDKIVGCVMTNQARKDWAVAIHTLARLPAWKGWFHTDTDVRHWNIPELLAEFGVRERVKLTYTGSMSDSDLAFFYSACNVTILPSSEGFGFPIAESLACGTPVIHTSHAGGCWGLDTVKYIAPATYRIEGPFNRVRPVFDSEQWAAVVERGTHSTREECVASVAHLDWDMLFPSRWAKWLKEGIGADRNRFATA